MERNLENESDGELKRAVAFALPFRLAILAVLMLTIAGAVLSALEPFVLKNVIDQLAGSEAWNSLLKGVIYLALIALFRETCTAVSNWLTWRTRLRMHSRLLDGMVERMHRMPLSLLRKEGVGGLMTRVDRSIQGFLNGIGQLLFSAIPSIAYLAVAIYLMFRLEPRLAWLVLAFTPLPLLVAARASPQQARRERLTLRTW